MMTLTVLAGLAWGSAVDEVDYAKQIQPIIEKHCYKCHSAQEKKPKGDLRLDTPDLIMRGAKDGVVVVAGKPDDSRLIQRISLPLDHDDVMPPKDKAEPLTKDQIALLRKWIEQGPKFGEGVVVTTALPKEPELRKAPAADPKVLEKIRETGALAMPLAANTNLLSVNYHLVGTAIKDEHLAPLKAISEQLVELNLGKTAVTDAGLAHLAGLKWLERLHLEQNAVTDAGLPHLKGLAELQYLNLYETKVTDAGLEHLKGLKKLRKLYLWKSEVTEAGAKALTAALPELQINRGEELAKVEAVAEAVKTPPPINAKCPLTDRDVDPSVTFVYKGQTIAFCCADCQGKFAAEPDKLIAKVKEFKSPAEEGFLKTWLVLAPIPTSGENTHAADLEAQQIPNEGALAPKAGERVSAGGADLEWKEYKAPEYFVDFRAHVGDARFEDVIGYAVCYVTAEAEIKDLSALIGSNDMAKVYLNGQQIFKTEATRGLEKDQDKVENVTLKQGLNVVVLKVVNTKNNWAGCLRFVDKAGAPPKIKASAAKP
jgi:mono/diheme cytochrome c family protein